MARIRHIAIMTENQSRLADFYKNTFGLKEVHRHVDAWGGEAVYLSDGEINLAILPARGGAEGINHFGFQVDDVEAARTKAHANGGRVAADLPKEVPRDGRFAEGWVVDPAGTRIDLSQQGWKT